MRNAATNDARVASSRPVPNQARRACFQYLVIVTAAAHFGYLVYVPSGGFLALRRPRTRWLHLASVCWGVAVVALRWPCPLTSLENWARTRAGMNPLPAGGFIDHYLAGVCYPPDRTGTARTAAFGAAAASWIALGAKHRGARRVQRSGHGYPTSQPTRGKRRHLTDKKFRKGDKVEWQSHGSTVVGTVQREITSDTEAAGRTVRAVEG